MTMLLTSAPPLRSTVTPAGMVTSALFAQSDGVRSSLTNPKTSLHVPQKVYLVYILPQLQEEWDVTTYRKVHLLQGVELAAQGQAAKANAIHKLSMSTVCIARECSKLGNGIPLSALEFGNSKTFPLIARSHPAGFLSPSLLLKASKRSYLVMILAYTSVFAKSSRVRRPPEAIYHPWRAIYTTWILNMSNVCPIKMIYLVRVRAFCHCHLLPQHHKPFISSHIQFYTHFQLYEGVGVWYAQ